jgi:hypothetical protein
MDRIGYCDGVEARLQDLRTVLSQRAFPEPATLAAARTVAAVREKHEALVQRVDAALARVRALRAGADAGWETVRDELDRELAAIERLRTGG